MNSSSIPAERTLFVSKYPSSTSTEQLKKTFSEFGAIEQIVSHGPGVCIIYQKNGSVQAALQKTITLDGQEPYISQFLNLDQLDSEANIFIDNLDPKETQQSLKQLLSQFGTILSIQVQKSDKMGIAYIQFDKKEQADKCIAEQSKLGLKIQKFKKQHRDQVYVSGIKPNQNSTPDQLKQELQNFMEEFGQVESLILNRNTSNGTFFAFIKFINSDNARQAVKSNKLFNNQQISIEWVVKNTEKDIEANLFTKNIKITVTEQQLRAAFSKLVPIEDVKLQRSKQPAVGGKPPTQIAYLYFKTAEDGKKVIAEAFNTPEIFELYEKELVHLSPLLPPSEVNSVLQVKKNAYQKLNYQPQFPQYQPYPPQQPRYPQHPRQYNNGGNRQYQQKQRPYQQPQFPEISQLQYMCDNGQKQQVNHLIGQQLFPRVMNIVGPANAPLVTGILLDFENYQLSDQVKMVFDQAFLSENVRQALDLLK